MSTYEEIAEEFQAKADLWGKEADKQEGTEPLTSMALRMVAGTWSDAAARLHAEAVRDTPRLNGIRND